MSQIALWDGADAVPLKPFWRYFGGKWRSSLLYPQPKHGTIIEPFAGSAGYSLRYPDLNVILVERYDVIAEIWRWLIKAPAAEIRRIPQVEDVDDLPAWVPQGARWLVGFCMNSANATPCKTPSRGLMGLAAKAKASIYLWENMRERVASQVERIRHWVVIEDDYSLASRFGAATYYVDPPYSGDAGRHYKEGPKGSDEDLRAWYSALGQWCRDLPGQVIVCENAGATWLPFRSFGQFRKGFGQKFQERPGSREVIWLNEWDESAKEIAT